MPGILPMKVIKVGNGSQSRIAQACDRCRSKKIRCDGTRPCCTQCANVGFECKTSDKLSRRAFPRGYTESLEERVRNLEAEVRELKGLLDEKDEKIDVLSRIRSFASQQPAKSMSPPATGPQAQSSRLEEDVIQVQQSLQGVISSGDSPTLPALSNTRHFANIFANMILKQGNQSQTISTEALTATPSKISSATVPTSTKRPPRLATDQLINIFFQEWAPLYPVVHRPTILKAYEEFLSDEVSLQGDRGILTQLNLIFGIAALSSTARNNQDPTSFEANWSSTLESLSGDVSLGSLQCFVLAEIYYMAKADYQSLLQYRAIATALCHQLSLHQSQARFGLNTLATETRKKVFWCHYVLDRFAALLTGLPVLLREDDICAEYPADVDDENVTDTGFLPTLPGEFTRLSSAIALIGVSRILNTALDVLYSSEVEYDIPVSKLRSVMEELDSWLRNLPPHLRLEFSRDKPSTNVTSSRSPILSLIYYFIRSLIHRPAVCFADRHISSPSVLALADSSKHIVQIVQLLDERRLCLSVSINRKELVFLSGIGLLWQTIGLKRDSKLAKESRRFLTTIIDQLESESSSAAAEFSAIAYLLTSNEGENLTHSVANKEMRAPPPKSRSPKKQLQAWKARLSEPTASVQSAKSDSVSRRNTITGAQPSAPQQLHRSPSRCSFHSQPGNCVIDQRRSFGIGSDQHLVYPIRYDNSRTMSSSSLPKSTGETITMADWEYVLSDMDNGLSNIFNGIYGGTECVEDRGPFAALTAEFDRKPHDDLSIHLSIPQPEFQDLSPESWSSSSGEGPVKLEDYASPRMLSLSEESMGSAEGLMTTFGDTHISLDEQSGFLGQVPGIVIPSSGGSNDGYGLMNGWDRRLAV